MSSAANPSTRVLTPSIDLGELFGNRLLVYRAPENRSRWLFQDPYLRDVLTGGLGPAAGTLAALCSRAALQVQSRELFERAGLPVGTHLIPFDDGAHHQRLLEELAPQYDEIILQHAYPASEVEHLRLWVPLEALSRVNNKGELSRFVSEPHLSPRSLVDPGELERVLTRLPAVVKAATDDSTGGGFDVVICRSRSEAETARRFFEGLERVVVEEWQEFVQTLCMHYVISREGNAQYFGAAEQVVSEDGRHVGNWLGVGVDPPEAMIEEGLLICRRAWEAGYWGLAGIDMGILGDGEFRVFDLNFRLNSSTAAALLLPSLIAWRGLVAARSGRWTFGVDFPALIPFLEEEIDRGHFVPINICDARMTSWPDRAPYVGGLLVGESREEVQALERRWLEKAQVSTFGS